MGGTMAGRRERARVANKQKDEGLKQSDVGIKAPSTKVPPGAKKEIRPTPDSKKKG